MEHWSSCYFTPVAHENWKPMMSNDMSEATEGQSCDVPCSPSSQPRSGSCRGPCVLLWKVIPFWCPPRSLGLCLINEGDLCVTVLLCVQAVRQPPVPVALNVSLL